MEGSWSLLEDRPGMLNCPSITLPTGRAATAESGDTGNKRRERPDYPDCVILSQNFPASELSIFKPMGIFVVV